MSDSKKTGSCKYNEWIDCSDYECSRCGFNANNTELLENRTKKAKKIWDSSVNMKKKRSMVIKHVTEIVEIITGKGVLQKKDIAKISFRCSDAILKAISECIEKQETSTVTEKTMKKEVPAILKNAG